MIDRKSKQVIVMRKDLQMTKGKMIAQGSHASLGVILEMMNGVNSVENKEIINGEYSLTLNVKVGDMLDNWLRGGSKKVCLYVTSKEELIEIYNKAKAKKLPAIMIEDEGRTMFKGVTTKTCVAIGPAGEEDIDQITGKLKLL